MSCIEIIIILQLYVKGKVSGLIVSSEGKYNPDTQASVSNSLHRAEKQIHTL